jgi:hypothetical protein
MARESPFSAAIQPVLILGTPACRQEYSLNESSQILYRQA